MQVSCIKVINLCGDKGIKFIDSKKPKPIDMYKEFFMLPDQNNFDFDSCDDISRTVTPDLKKQRDKSVENERIDDFQFENVRTDRIMTINADDQATFLA